MNPDDKRKNIASSMLKGAGVVAGGSIVYDNLTKGGVTSALKALAAPSAVDAVSGATVTPSALNALKAVPDKISSSVKGGLDSASKVVGIQGLENANQAVGNAVALGLGGATAGALFHLLGKGAKAVKNKVSGDMSSKIKDVNYHINYADSHYKSMEPIIRYGKRNNVDHDELWQGYLESASSVRRATPKEAESYTKKVDKIAAEDRASRGEK